MEVISCYAGNKNSEFWLRERKTFLDRHLLWDVCQRCHGFLFACALVIVRGHLEGTSATTEGN